MISVAVHTQQHRSRKSFLTGLCGLVSACSHIAGGRVARPVAIALDY